MKKNKEVLREAINKYKELSETEKDIKRKYGRNRNKNMPEENKHRLKKYQKNYLETKRKEFRYSNFVFFLIV